jgi:predicted nuclease of predicted toxin-antitoxin system
MKLLLDQNLSPRLVQVIEDLFPGSRHVRDVDLQAADDGRVWAYAASHDFTIVSKDSDFHQMSFILGHPPKVVWIRLGNCSTTEVARILRAQAQAIHDFAADDESGFLALS